MVLTLKSVDQTVQFFLDSCLGLLSVIAVVILYLSNEIMALPLFFLCFFGNLQATDILDDSAINAICCFNTSYSVCGCSFLGCLSNYAVCIVILWKDTILSCGAVCFVMI